jgi:hypothetical protein
MGIPAVFATAGFAYRQFLPRRHGSYTSVNDK